jgi:hypothetical protein
MGARYRGNAAAALFVVPLPLLLVFGWLARRARGDKTSANRA